MGWYNIIMYQGRVNQTRLETVHCKIDQISYFMLYIVLMRMLPGFYSYYAASANLMLCALAALQEDTVEYVRGNMWYPEYSPLVHEK
jgi:hypothetical protein